MLFGVYVFQSGQTAAGTTSKASSGDEVSDFNAKFSIYGTEDKFDIGDDDANRIKALTNYNNVADVVTAINLAYNVNYENNLGYKYADQRGIETDNAVLIIVHINSETYYLAPNKDAEEGKIYKLSLSGNRSNIVSYFKSLSSSQLSSDGVATSTNYFLENFSETKLLEYNNSYYSIYQYYFEGKYELNPDTGQIYSLEFTMFTDGDWDTLSY